MSVDPEDGDIEGFIYNNYSIGDAKSHGRDESSFENPSHFWAGRFAVFPLEDDQIRAIEPKWLMSESKFDDFTDNLPTSQAFAAIKPHVYTVGAARDMAHEKVHGVQDFRVPLPILEASANFYQREVGQANDWDFKAYGNMNGLADLYGSCVKEFGEDVHRLLFGNIEDKNKRKEILDKVKSKFTPEKIEEVSMEGSISGLPNHLAIHWKKIPTAEVRKEIESKNRGKYYTFWIPANAGMTLCKVSV